MERRDTKAANQAPGAGVPAGAPALARAPAACQEARHRSTAPPLPCHASRAMREKELRIALVCYGGISLAVYMHGVTKEVWRLARASRAFHAAEPDPEMLGRRLLPAARARSPTRRRFELRVLVDILAGASAGGINAVFLSHAIVTGQPLDPLTDLWLDSADVDELLDSEVEHRLARRQVGGACRSPGCSRSARGAVERDRRRGRSATRSAPSSPISSARAGSRRPSAGRGFTNLLLDAFEAMAKAPPGVPLLPGLSAARPVRHRHRFPRLSRNGSSSIRRPRSASASIASPCPSRTRATTTCPSPTRSSWSSPRAPPRASPAPSRRSPSASSTRCSPSAARHGRAATPSSPAPCPAAPPPATMRMRC